LAADASSPTLMRFTSRRPGVVGMLGIVVVGFVLLWLVVNAFKTPGDFFDLLLVGLTVGMVYALIALGYSLVYGILELINFAHGDVFMLGAMMTTTLVASFGIGTKGSAGHVLLLVVPMLVIAMAFCALLNVTIEFIAYRPLRGAPRLAPLITAIGASFIVQNAGLVWKGPAPVNLRNNLLPLFSVAGAEVRWNRLIVFGVTLPTLALLVWLVQKTKQGKAMRAVAQDQDAAAIMGINVNRTISFTFLIAGALAGAAGTMYALYVTSVSFDTGFRLGLFAFTAAVLGGIGNLPGAVLGALLIGLIEQFNNGLSWHSPGSDWTNSIIFSVLILILVFRPEGLLGERTPEGG
jgi:branched-chain amino acid transport system permease protein